MKIFTALLFVLSVLLPEAALASQGVNMAVLNQPKVPVKLIACYASLTDTDVGNGDYYLDVATQFQTTSAKEISAIRIRFDALDTFYTKLGTYAATYQAGAKMQPYEGRPIEGPYVAGYMRMPTHDDRNHGWASDADFINTTSTVAGVICSVDTIKFADGSIWQAPRLTPVMIQSVGQFIGPDKPTYTVIR